MSDLEQYFSRFDSIIARAVKSVKLGDHLDCGLTGPQFMLLKYLMLTGRGTISEISHALGVTASAITFLSDKLVAAGLAVRERDESDRRLVWLKTTPEGEAKVKAAEEKRRQFFARKLSRLSPEEIETLLELMEKIMAEEPEERQVTGR